MYFFTNDKSLGMMILHLFSAVLDDFSANCFGTFFTGEINPVKKLGFLVI